MTADEIRERARTELVVAIENGVWTTKTIRTIIIGATVTIAPVLSFAGDERGLPMLAMAGSRVLDRRLEEREGVTHVSDVTLQSCPRDTEALLKFGTCHEGPVTRHLVNLKDAFHAAHYNFFRY